MTNEKDLEDVFFLQYHLGWSVQSIKAMKPWERRWIIDRFIEEKKRQRGKDGE